MTQRPSHRKRISALRLSSDTTHSLLPVYAPTPEDRPPDYEAGDEDSESDSSCTAVASAGPSASVPPSASAASASVSFSPSPRRKKAFAQHQHQHHRRRKSTAKSISASNSSADPYLDSLLARSVHALEMSNTLLQSSMSTQKSLSAMCAAGESSAEDEEEAVEGPETCTLVRGVPRAGAGAGAGVVRARDLGLEDEEGEEVQPKWASDLAEISRGVDGLFDSEPGEPANTHANASVSLSPNLSSSLPSSSSLGVVKHSLAHRRRPSLLELRDVDANANAMRDLHASLSSPRLTDTPFEPSTPAYTKLASFVTPSPRHPSTSSPNFLSLSRRSSTASNRTKKDHSPSPAHAPRQSPHDRSPHSLTPKQIIATLPHHHHNHHHLNNAHRPMTPPTEESSTSSDDSCPAKLTLLSLRKILDEQPPPPPQPPQPQRLRAPAFHPRTPAPAPQAQTSTATASVSRLLTKNKHTSSTRAPSPPRQSAMKRSPLGVGTPTPTAGGASGDEAAPATVTATATTTTKAAGASEPPSVLTLPDLNLNLNFGLLRVPSWASLSSASAPSSGRSTPTPKRISFAALPESYAGSRPGGRGSSRSSRKKRKKSSGLRGEGDGDEGDGDEGSGDGEGDGGWWGGWFLGPGSVSGVKGHGGYGEERVEERLGRSWGGRMPGAAGFGPGMDEWAI
ncbi:hypothetical protein H0H92_010492 [Tricholoma furcatifolium]|nr:hypothetical protein H0H92_010492 [Tricholoma furcatifolium]